MREQDRGGDWAQHDVSGVRIDTEHGVDRTPAMNAATWQSHARHSGNTNRREYNNSDGQCQECRSTCFELFLGVKRAHRLMPAWDENKPVSGGEGGVVSFRAIHSSTYMIFRYG